ncbi:Inositol phosphorylceramide glucuronosyltransferase 1 [Nymphaea thermarum]|nr:Inositol phosphorylceramide glucuronosyltransferase 1 [Nymphaea thermarum]
METIARPLALLVVFFLFLRSGSSARNPQSEEAYVTLLYGDEFLLGVRVLGKSIRDTGATKDMVVLVSDGVSDYAKELLRADGWIIEPISLLANPNAHRPKRFWGVYTKLKIFNLTKYKKVVYLDADTIVIKSVEDLFRCGKFCANLKHSERLNSGVLVVEPSETLYRDMMSKVNTLPSYTGGDQGFLNSYYTGFANAHIFEPNASLDGEPEMQRLSTLYNADVGLYMLANKWMVDERELRIIHYTLGPLKPWDWWTAWLLKPVDVWQEVRIQLKESLPGTGGGGHFMQQLFVKVLFVLPLIALVFFYYRSYCQVRKEMVGTYRSSSLFNCMRNIFSKCKIGNGYSAVGVTSSPGVGSGQQFSSSTHLKVPSFLGSISIFVCFGTCILSLGLGLLIVPRQVMPWTGLLLLYEWTFTLFFVMFGSYLYIICELGKESSSSGIAFSVRSDYPDWNSVKGNLPQPSSCDKPVAFYWIGMALLAIVAPSLPCLFGITALFLRLGLMVAGGMVLVAFMTYASEHLAIIAYTRGRDAIIGRLE